MNGGERPNLKVHIDGFMAGHGGIGTHIHGLLHGLSQLQPTFGIACCIGPDHGIPEGIHRLPPIRGRLYGFRRRVRLALPPGAALWHFPHWNVPFSWPRGLPRVITVHDLTHLRIPEAGGGRLRTAYIRQWIQTAIAGASVIVTGTHHARNDILGEFRADPPSVQVIGNGLDPNWQPLPRAVVEATLQRLGISQPYLFIAGSTKPHKNLRWAIEQADKFLTGSRQPHRLVVTCGSSELRCLSTRLVRLDHLTRIDLRAMMQGASGVIFPSLYEGFGFPAIEAQALGVPLACSNASCLPEVAGGDDCAAYFHPQDSKACQEAMERILCAEHSGALVAAGRRNAMRYQWIDVARRICDVWQGLIH